MRGLFAAREYERIKDGTYNKLKVRVGQPMNTKTMPHCRVQWAACLKYSPHFCTLDIKSASAYAESESGCHFHWKLNAQKRTQSGLVDIVGLVHHVLYQLRNCGYVVDQPH